MQRLVDVPKWRKNVRSSESGYARNQYTIIDPSNGLSQFLETSDSERDLGVIISHDLKPKNQVQKAASKANDFLGLLRNTFVSKDPLIWKKLYTSYVKPYLEYAIPAWSPYTKADKHTLEKVQDTNLIPHWNGIRYQLYQIITIFWYLIARDNCTLKFIDYRYHFYTITIMRAKSIIFICQLRLLRS